MHAEAPNPLVRRFEEEVLVNTQDLYRAAARLTERAADAEDLVQETCLQAFRSYVQLRDARATKTWIHPAGPGDRALPEAERDAPLRPGVGIA